MIITKKKPKGTRIVSKFMLFPKTIHGITIWLERASIVQEYTQWEGFAEWVDKAWVMNSKIKNYYE